MANAALHPALRARVGGSGLTLYRWSFGGESDFFSMCRQTSHQAPVAVGNGVVAIHPMDRQYPEELITPQAQGMGTLVLEFYEPVQKQFWENVPGLVSLRDLVDVFIKVANVNGQGDGFHVTKYIFDPSQTANQYKTNTSNTLVARPSTAGAVARQITYHFCVVSALDDGEQVDITSMEIMKRMTLNYTYWTLDNANMT